MTNEELDAACGIFAELPTLAGHAFEQPEKNDKAGWCGVYYEGRSAHKYPSFSTDWAAAGRLRDALRAKGCFTRSSDNSTEFLVEISHPQHPRIIWATADTGPRALCLAVAALAEASGKEAGR